jgi:glucokinase
MSQAAMTALNELLVLDLVRAAGETTRAAIARGSGLSPASISRIVGRLVRAGLVVETASPTGARGRPATTVRFNGRAGSVLAVDLGGTRCHGVLADLDGTVVCEDVRQTHGGTSPFGALVASVGRLRREALAAGLPLVAAAVGVPAIVDPDSGLAMEGPNVAWRDFAIVRELRRHLDVPFVVDNDVKLAAIGQAWRGRGRGVRDFVTISIGTGVGAALVANGELVRGRHNAAGEIGYLVVDRERLHQPRLRGLGALEAVISGPAISARAGELAVGGADASGSPITAEEVFRLADRGDPAAMQVIDEVVEHLSVALVSLVALADPALVILDGGVGRSLEPYLAEIERRIAPSLPSVPALAVSALEPSGTIAGAIAMALSLDRERAGTLLAPRRPTHAGAFAHGA